MQASLHDFASSRNSPSFSVCQRVLHRCHEIIFNNLPRPSSSPYPSSTHSTHSPFSRRKLSHRPQPALVGMGVILAAAPAMPLLAQSTGQIAIEQGRADHPTDLPMLETDLPPDLTPMTPGDDTDDPESPHSPSLPDDSDSKPPVVATAAQTMPALPLHLRSIQRSRASQDPLGQLDAQIPSPSHHSTLSLPAPMATTPNTPDILLEKYDVTTQSQLLRGHYYHSQVCQLCKPALHLI